MEQYSDKIAAITKKHLKDMQENTQRLQLEFDEKILKANNQAQQEIENIKLELSQKNWELEDKNLALLKKSNNLEEVIGQLKDQMKEQQILHEGEMKNLRDVHKENLEAQLKSVEEKYQKIIDNI